MRSYDQNEDSEPSLCERRLNLTIFTRGDLLANQNQDLETLLSKRRPKFTILTQFRTFYNQNDDFKPSLFKGPPKVHYFDPCRTFVQSKSRFWTVTFWAAPKIQVLTRVEHWQLVPNTLKLNLSPVIQWAPSGPPFTSHQKVTTAVKNTMKIVRTSLNQVWPTSVRVPVPEKFIWSFKTQGALNNTRGPSFSPGRTVQIRPADPGAGTGPFVLSLTTDIFKLPGSISSPEHPNFQFAYPYRSYPSDWRVPWVTSGTVDPYGGNSSRPSVKTQIKENSLGWRVRTTVPPPWLLSPSLALAYVASSLLLPPPRSAHLSAPPSSRLFHHFFRRTSSSLLYLTALSSPFAFLFTICQRCLALVTAQFCTSDDLVNTFDDPACSF